jgi:putative ABC transport system ATP-binding protein
VIKHIKNRNLIVTTSDLVITASQLNKRVSGPEGTITILEDVELGIRAGEAVSILGASGSGKSTLIGLLAGLDQSSAGKVSLLGRDLSTLDEDGRAQLRAGRVGFVFQSFHLLPGMTALENVALAIELGDSQTDPNRRARELLQRVGLEQRAAHYPNQLSGGEQQRVAIARAFADSPQVMFADEPTGNLDTETGRRVSDMLFRLRDELGTALVLVTHDSALADRCDRRYRLDKGRLEGIN